MVWMAIALSFSLCNVEENQAIDSWPLFFDVFWFTKALWCWDILTPCHLLQPDLAATIFSHWQKIMCISNFGNLQRAFKLASISDELHVSPAVLGVTTCWIYASIGRERLAPRIPSNETSWDMRWYDHIQGFKVAMTWQAKPVPMPHLGGSLPSRAPRQAGSSELQTCFCLFPSYLLWMSLFSFHSICIW